MLSRAQRVAARTESVEFTWGRPAPASAGPTLEATPDPAGAFVAERRVAEIERHAFASGFSQGESAGLEAGVQRADAMLRRLSETLEALASLRADMIRQTERQMLQLALAIAKRILQREVALDPDLTIAMARVGLDRLQDAPTAKIRLHPEDYARSVTCARPLASHHVSVVADDAIGRGGCRIESDFGFVEAGVEAQFDEIASALMGDTHLAGPPPADRAIPVMAQAEVPVGSEHV